MSTLAIHDQLRDALQALLEPVIAQVEADSLVASATALEAGALGIPSQALDAGADAWRAVTATFGEGFANVLSAVHQPAVDAAGAAPEAIPTGLTTSAAALSAQVAAIEGELDRFREEDAQARADSVDRHDAFKHDLRDFTHVYQDSYDSLRQAVEGFGSALEERMQPDLVQRMDDWLNALETLRSARLAALEADMRDTFARAAEEFMDLAENAVNMYRDAAYTAASELERFAVDQVGATLDASVERLKRTAISMVEGEIANAIVETNLSVALTSALSPVMPQLIAFYKAVTLLEEAIRIFKEMKKAFSLGL